MAKVSIVKWSLKWIFVDGSAISRIPNDFEIALKTAIFKIFGYARNGTSVNKNLVLRPLNNKNVCHITIMKWSQINKYRENAKSCPEKSHRFLMCQVFFFY